MAGRVNSTERFAKAARADGHKSPIFFDDEVFGFGLQVRDNDRKTFTLDYALRRGAAAILSVIIPPERSRPRGTRRGG